MGIAAKREDYELIYPSRGTFDDHTYDSGPFNKYVRSEREREGVSEKRTITNIFFGGGGDKG